MLLESEWLDAKLRSRSSPAGSTAGLEDGRNAELVRVIARNAVYARSGGPNGRELIADVVDYDAVSGIAEAWANDDNRITLFERARATPIVARRLIWDTVRDRIDLVEPTPIVTPR